jgi:NAD(P)-dependent dehydrogenase (short-subunit alcohol dehydrogenase family)
MKVAVVTGAAQGIGRRAAEVLAGAGYELLLMDLQPCTGTVDAVKKDGVGVVEVLGDISDEAVVTLAGEAVQTRWALSLQQRWWRAKRFCGCWR